MLVLLLACEPVAVAPVQPTPVSSETQPERGDACQRDIPDCEAACALREVHRTAHLDWFDRRCAAVVLGKNPDRIDAASTARPTPPASCDPPYMIDAEGHKKWKPECFD